MSTEQMWKLNEIWARHLEFNEKYFQNIEGLWTYFALYVSLNLCYKLE